MSDLIKAHIIQELSQLLLCAATMLTPEEFARALINKDLEEAHLRAIVDEAQKVLAQAPLTTRTWSPLLCVGGKRG